MKFLYEWLGRTVMVNSCFPVLGNNFSHLTCFPRTSSLSYQALEFMSFIFEARLGFVIALTEVRLIDSEVINIGHKYTTHFCLVCWNGSKPGCEETHRCEGSSHMWKIQSNSDFEGRKRHLSQLKDNWLEEAISPLLHLLFYSGLHWIG